MAKCEKCGKEYQDGTEHICSSPEEEKSETNVSQEEKATPEEETQPQKSEDSTQEKTDVEKDGKKEGD